MSWEFTVSLLGTVLSFASLVFARPNWKSRAIHFLYTGVIIAIMVFMTSRLIEETAISDKANQRIAAMQNIQIQAKSLLDTIPTYSSDEGTNRGTVLKVLSFLEKFHPELPITFSSIQKLANGVGLTEEAKPYFEGGREQSESFQQAGAAARSIVEGLAANKPKF